MRSVLKRGIAFAFENSLLLLIGTAASLIWANLDEESYRRFVHFAFWSGRGSHPVDVQFLVNDVLMSFFFALAGKEVLQAMHPSGPLSEWRTAALPLLAAIGGMAGPAVLYLAGAALIGRLSELAHGWAVPCATDVVFSYMVARLVFPTGHPAASFLLLLSIADDAFGLIIIALFYPQAPIHPVWLLLTLAAVATGLLFHQLRLKNFWWYLAIPGTMSWTGLALTGLHPALGLLPILPVLPSRFHERFDWHALGMEDTLRRFGTWWKNPVEIITGLFALTNAGVVLSHGSAVTVLVLAALILGKPVGITLSSVLGVKAMKLQLPLGLSWWDLVVVGCAAGIGFTVAMFLATVAFPPGALQEAAKMGALGSFVAAVITYVVAGFTRGRGGVSQQS
jgi:Na+:H+ antiporter, NhaA family